MFYNFPLLSFSAKFKICRAKLAIERCRFKIYQNYYAFPAEGPKIWGVTKKTESHLKVKVFILLLQNMGDSVCPGPPPSDGSFIMHDKSFSSMVRGKKIRFNLKAKNEKEDQIVLFVDMADFDLWITYIPNLFSCRFLSIFWARTLFGLDVNTLLANFVICRSSWIETKVFIETHFYTTKQ